MTQQARPIPKKERRKKQRELAAKRREVTRKNRRTDDATKRLKKQKKADSKRASAKIRARVNAKNAVDYIGYDHLYADGIAQVEEGMFSQTIAFSDISYKTIRDEDQIVIFKIYSAMLNRFSPDVSVQLSVVNTPLSVDEGGRRFLTPLEGEAAVFAHDYNRMLNEKLREGVANFTRERYMTFMVGADNVDDAARQLAQIRNNASQMLERIKCKVRIVRGEERLGVLFSLLRPKAARPSDFYGAIRANRLISTKDLVCPSVIDFKVPGRRDCLCLDGTYAQVLYFRSYGTDLSDRILGDIVDLPMHLNLTLHIHPTDHEESKAFVSKRIHWMDKEIIDEQMAAVKKGYDFQILPPALRESKSEAENLYLDLEKRNQEMFGLTGLICVYADSLEELDANVDQVMSLAQGNALYLDTLAFRQREGFNSILPLGHDHTQVAGFVTTANIAICTPFSTPCIDMPGGVYYGQLRGTGSMLFVDRTKMSCGMGIVTAMPGFGKSFFVKGEVTWVYHQRPHDQIIMMDLAGENSPLINALGGTNYRIAADSPDHFNPFDTFDVADKSKENQTAFKLDAILAMSAATMAEGGEPLPETDRTIIGRCAEMAYIAAEKTGVTPTLGDFYEILLEQPEPAAAIIALRYECYVKGATSFFNHQSTINFDSRLVNIDLKDLSGNMRIFGMLAVLEAVRNRMYHNYERGITTWFYIDEIQSLFDKPAIINYFSRFWAEGRKFNLIATGITQNAEAMLAKSEARTVVMNSPFVCLFRQSAADMRAWSQILSLSSDEEKFIDDTTPPGDGLLIVDGLRVPMTNEIEKGTSVYEMMNTKPDEVAARKRAERFKRAADQAVIDKAKADASVGSDEGTRA